MTALLDAFGQLCAPWPMTLLLIGVVLGIVGGALPGITGAMMIALMLPITYNMDPSHALTLLIGMYVGAISGGLITATLMRMPGTPAAVMTTLDGYPMAMGGRPGRALGLGICASFIGGMVSCVFLVLLSKPLADFATRFGPYEYFTLVLMALVLIASVSQGSMIKGLLSGVLGMLFALPGVDPAGGTLRLTFGYGGMNSGLGLLPVLIGVFCVSQLISDIVNIDRHANSAGLSREGIWMTLKDWKDQAINLLRSSLIGTWVGILPGVGANIGSVIAYTAAKNMSDTPEEFGTGSEEGIIASEAANNATVGGALVPLIAMGIPGSVIDAILIGALMIHGIQPGPQLFAQEPQLVYGIMVAFLIANILMFGIMMTMVGKISKLMYVPRAYLLPPIIVFCIIGSYAATSTMFAVWVMLGFGVLGYFLEKAEVPLGPFVIGFVLAPIAETKLRAGLATYDGYSEMFTRPLSLTFLIASAILLLWPMIRQLRGGPSPNPPEAK